jgi:RIO kinase 1
VSQAVEREHSHALDFLRQDCTNVLHYFRQRGLKTLSLQRFFDFVTDPNIDDLTAWLADAHQMRVDDSTDALNTDKVAEEAHRSAMTEESVFRAAFIPRSIEEVINVERLVANRGKGLADDVFTKLTGLVVKDENDDGENSGDEDHSDYSCEGSATDHSDTEDDSEFDGQEKPDREAIRAQRKENKKLVKEEKRERRKHKIKKHVKKKATKSKK